MMGPESHPLEFSDARDSESMEDVTLDPLSAADSSSTYTLVATSVETHPLDLLCDDFSLEEEEQGAAEEVKQGEKEQEGEKEEDDRILSTGGVDRLIHKPLPDTNEDFLNIIVTQPQKEVDTASSIIPGGNYYVTYLVSARTNMQEYGKTEHGVRRRFKDIVALADSLTDKYRGYFIPSRPDKNVVESQFMDKHDFIEQRRIEIERYLRRLAAHPVLRKSEELRMFLVSKGKLPFVPTIDVASRLLDGAAKLPKQLFGEGQAPVKPQDVVRSAKGGTDLLRLLKELKQSVTNDWGASRPPVMEEDKEFLEKKEHLREYERRLLHTTQRAQELLIAQERLARVMGDHLGLSFLRLAKLETQSAASNTQRAHATDVRRQATAIVRASRLQKAAHNQTSRHLEFLNEHLAALQSAQAAFSERDNALLTLQTLLSDISMMHVRAQKHSLAASKIFGGDRSRNKKIDDLNDAIRVTEEACECAQQKYNQIKEVNRLELERTETEKQSEFLQMLRGFVQSQVGYAEKISKEWDQAVEESAEYSVKRVDTPIFKTSPSFARYSLPHSMC